MTRKKTISTFNYQARWTRKTPKREVVVQQPEETQPFEILVKGYYFGRSMLQYDALLDTEDANLNTQYANQLTELGVTPVLWIYESDLYPNPSLDPPLPPPNVRIHNIDQITKRASVNIPLLITHLEGTYGLQQNHPSKVYLALDYEEDWLNAISDGVDPIDKNIALSSNHDATFNGTQNTRATDAYIEIITALRNYFGPNVKISVYGIPQAYNFMTYRMHQESANDPNFVGQNTSWKLATPENKEKRIVAMVKQQQTLMNSMDWFMAHSYDNIPKASSLVANGGTVTPRSLNDFYVPSEVTDFDADSLIDDQRHMSTIEGTYRVIGQNSEKPLYQILNNTYANGVHFRSDSSEGQGKYLQLIPIPEVIDRIKTAKQQYPSLNGVNMWGFTQFTFNTEVFTSTQNPASNTDSYWLRTSVVRELYGGTNLNEPGDPIFDGTFPAWNDSNFKRDVAIRYNNRVVQSIAAIKQEFQ
jgi:hypothetical protein